MVVIPLSIVSLNIWCIYSKYFGFEGENPDTNINHSLLLYAVKYSGYLLRDKSSNLSYKSRTSDMFFFSDFKL